MNNPNYNYEDNQYQLCEETPLEKKDESHINIDLMTTDIMKETVQKSKNCLDLILKSKGKNLENGFKKTIQLIHNSLSQFIKKDDQGESLFLSSKVALSNISNFLRDFFRKVRIKTSMKKEEVIGLSFEIDYLLSRLGSCMLNFAPEIESDSKEQERDDYMIRKLKSGFRAILTQKVGIQLTRKIVRQIGIETLKEANQEDVAKTLKDEDFGVNFGDKFRSLTDQTRDFLLDEMIKIGLVSKEDEADLIQQETSRCGDTFRPIKTQSADFTDFELNIQQISIFSESFFYDNEDLVVCPCNNGFDSFIVAGNKGLLLEFSGNSMIFGKKFSNKQWKSCISLKKHYLLYNALNQTFYQKEKESITAPKPWKKVSFQSWNMNIVVDYYQSAEVLIFPNSEKTIGVYQLKEKLQKDGSQTHWYKNRETENKTVFNHYSTIKSLRALSKSRFLFSDKKCDFFLVQFFPSSGKSTLLNKLKCPIEEPEEELFPSKVLLTENEKFAFVALNTQTMNKCLLVLELNHTRRVQLHKIIKSQFKLPPIIENHLIFQNSKKTENFSSHSLNETSSKLRKTQWKWHSPDSLTDLNPPPAKNIIWGATASKLSNNQQDQNPGYWLGFHAVQGGKKNKEQVFFNEQLIDLEEGNQHELQKRKYLFEYQGNKFMLGNNGKAHCFKLPRD